jgi:Mn-dependent DtxR family transcriptional regulator
MLEGLLQLVAEGGIHSYEDLLRRLSISQPLLEAMLEDLSSLGYLRRVGDRCEGQCSGCAVGGCSVAGPGRIWSLTEKGKRAAARTAAS